MKMSEKNPQIACVVMASGEGKRFGPQRGGKLLAPLGGMAVLALVLQALPAEEFCEMVVVTRWPAVEALCRNLQIPCVRHDGALRSDTIRAGLRAVTAGSRGASDGLIGRDVQSNLDKSGDLNETDNQHNPDACLFVAGDQPLLTEESVRKMLQVWEEAWKQAQGSAKEQCFGDESAGKCVVCRLGWKQEGGNPILFPAAMFDALYSLKGNRGGASLLRGNEMQDKGSQNKGIQDKGMQGKGIEVLVVEAGSPYELMDVDTPEALAELEAVCEGAIIGRPCDRRRI